MTDEEKELFNSYKEECEALWHIAQRLDAFYPETENAFTGNPSDRIARQLNKLLNTDVFETKEEI